MNRESIHSFGSVAETHQGLRLTFTLNIRTVKRCDLGDFMVVSASLSGLISRDFRTQRPVGVLSMRGGRKRMARPLRADGGWATTEEDHISLHACQTRTRIRSYSGRRITESGQSKIGKKTW